MTARSSARRFVPRIAGAFLGAAALSVLSPGCYSSAGGTAPPPAAFYFPVGLAVSSGGNVLYAVNSDFDLQFNGGTLQSYDLSKIRHDTAELIKANFPASAAPGDETTLNHDITFLVPWRPGCMSAGLVQTPLLQQNGSRVPLGQACAPPVSPQPYVKNSVTIGAFATDLQLSRDGLRLFAPIRGDGTLTWAVVAKDSPENFDCGPPGARCDAAHQTGAIPDDRDTRQVTLPGEPFAMAQTPDGTAIVITHQSTGETSLLLSGLSPYFPGEAPPPMPVSSKPSMQFVLEGVPSGGAGIVAVPHDLDAPTPPCEFVKSTSPCVRPAFLETTHNAAEIDLLRYYDDDGSSIPRPFLVREAAYPLVANSGGTDSRDIVIDASPRAACKKRSPANVADCAKIPARVFFASRTPPALVIGEIGEPSTTASTGYDPDRLVITGNMPISNGGSRVYLAPIVDRTGHYALRVFVVCFDAAQIFIYDPDAGIVENVIDVAPGPFAMAFDPFDMDKVAQKAPVLPDTRQRPELNLKTYRFAYLASFTQSFVQVIDLDNSIPQTSNVTFERVVYTLGQPTNPKGS